MSGVSPHMFTGLGDPRQAKSIRSGMTRSWRAGISQHHCSSSIAKQCGGNEQRRVVRIDMHIDAGQFDNKQQNDAARISARDLFCPGEPRRPTGASESEYRCALNG